jgi:hypothetical protein
MSAPSKRTKFEVMFDVFERFYGDLAKLSDPVARKLCQNWYALRPQYLRPPPGVKRSQLAQGLEQGLREMPLLFQSLTKQDRAAAAKAYHSALESEYPAFLASERERLAKVVGRGRIAGESEFHLVRHAIDFGEGGTTDPNTLGKLYGLVDAFQAKGRHGA